MSTKRSYHVKAGNWLREHRGIYKLGSLQSPVARV
jgi:hypothetical protein